MNELHLFAGAGGGVLAGQLLGDRTVCAVEWEPYAQAILVARQNDGTFPPFPIWDDVRTFDGTPWRGIVDIISGGFPCQDISAQGGVMASTESVADYGQKWRGLLARYDPNTSALKTAQCSLVEDSTPSSLTLPNWGLMLNGDVFQHPLSALPITVIESGLLPTPMASDWKGGTACIRKRTGLPRLDQFRHWIKVKHGLTYPIPEHSEAVMGWPIGHTDLKPLATAKYREWQQQHSNF